MDVVWVTQVRIGAVINMDIEDVNGCNGSLVNSFMELAKGWSQP